MDPDPTERFRYRFIPNAVELARIADFEDEHDLPGCMVSVSFTSVGIGEVIRARCLCGFESDVSDYDCW